MALILSRQVQQQLLQWADEAGANECCGLLLGWDGRASSAIWAQNVAADPSRHFEIDPATLIAAEREARSEGPPVIGYFHSHPGTGSCEPSACDIASAANDGRFWVILAAGKMQAWQPIGPQGGEVERFQLVAINEG